MFAFVGKLMGVAIRNRQMLNLDFPSIVWKQLVSDPVTTADVVAVDAVAFNILDSISTFPEEAFNECCDYNFTVKSADGKDGVELYKGGKDVKVTFKNKDEFIRLWREYKIHEFDTQLTAMRNGLSTLVPVQVLSLFTWDELELLVCGKPEINIDYLKENTRYEQPYSKDHASIAWLWQVLQDFTQKERECFLCFVWGRSRLPLTQEKWLQKFQVTGCSVNTDLALPITHTCFFHLELPAYTSREVMAQKLRYAINNCKTISNF